MKRLISLVVLSVALFGTVASANAGPPNLFSQADPQINAAVNQTVTLGATWTYGGPLIVVTKDVSASIPGIYFVELRPTVNGVEMLDAQPAKYVVVVR